MILLIDHRTVILTPPKTASDTLHRVFCSGPPWNGLAVVGPHHGVVDKHYPHVPNEAFRFKVLLTVRHPLDRLVSLWHHKCRLAAWAGEASESFPRFVNGLAAGEVVTWLWKTTIVELIGDQRIDGVLKCESLADDLAGVGLPVDAKHRHNTSFRRPWQDYYDAGLLATVEPWARPDIERFGYDPSPRASEPCLNKE
jgi:hypothetical protein